MALDSWMTKVKSAISTGLDPLRWPTTTTTTSPNKRKNKLGILAFETAVIMSKLLHLYRSLSDANLPRLRHAISLEGVRKIVSDDDSFLLSLACAEFIDNLRLVVESISHLSHRCLDPDLRQFKKRFQEFADSGLDAHQWTMNSKEMSYKIKKMDRYVKSTAALYKEIEELAASESGLRKLLHSKNSSTSAAVEIQQRIFWQKQEVQFLKQTSLWSCCSFDTVTSMLARSAFTVLSRIKQVFGVGHPRVVSDPATVHPSSDAADPDPVGLLESSARMTAPPPETLGAAALAMRYAGVVLAIERILTSPGAVGPGERDELYASLPAAARGILRRRLRGLWAARDESLAAEWRLAAARILNWLAPMAERTVTWQADRSFDRRRGERRGVTVVETLVFANREKVEAAVGELLVGLNYICRFDRDCH